MSLNFSPVLLRDKSQHCFGGKKEAGIQIRSICYSTKRQQWCHKMYLHCHCVKKKKKVLNQFRNFPLDNIIRRAAHYLIL